MCVVCVQPDKEQTWQEEAGVLPDEMDLATKEMVVLAKMQTCLVKEVKNRKGMLRREQLSLGVLDKMLQSLGRLVLEQVQCGFLSRCLVFCTTFTRRVGLCCCHVF